MQLKMILLGAASISGLASTTSAQAQTYNGASYGGTADPGPAYAQPAYAQPVYDGPAPTYPFAYPTQPCALAACAYAPPPVQFVPLQPAAEDLPPAGAEGQCFAKVLIPEVTETVGERVELSPGRTDMQVHPGEVRAEQKPVLVKEAHEELTSIPATYRTVTETVVVKRATTRTEVVPAVYDVVTEQIKVRDGYETWRPGNLVAGYAASASAAYGSAPTSKPEGGYGPGVIEHNPAYGGLTTRALPTGGVLCLIKVPPEYRTITKQVLRTPSRTVQVPVPEVTQTITRQVVDQPAHVERRLVPAVYGTITVKSESPDHVDSVSTPPVFDTLAHTRVVQHSRFEWRQVDCRGDVQPIVYPVTQQPYGYSTPSGAH